MPSQSDAPPKKQKRTEEMREKIILAGTTLFSEQGYHAISSKKIARAAGVAIGSFYNYFKDKKDLLFEIRRRHAEEIHQLVNARLRALFTSGDVDGQTLCRQLVQQTLAMHSFSPSLHRELSALAYSDADFAAAKRSDESEAVKIILTLLDPHHAALRVKDPEAAAWVVSCAVEAVIHSIKSFGTPLSEQRVTDALGDMIYRLFFNEG